MQLTKTRAVRFLYAAAFLGGALLAPGPWAQAATQYGAGTLLQIGDVKTSHILDGTILNADVSNSASIDATKVNPRGTSGTLLITDGSKVASTTLLMHNNSTGSTTVNGQLSITGNLKLGGVTYTPPGTDGASGQALQTNGAGVLSWASAASSRLSFTAYAGENLALGDAVMATSTTVRRANTTTGNVPDLSTSGSFVHTTKDAGELQFVGVSNENQTGGVAITGNGV